MEQHHLHAKTEIRLQWIVIFFMALGLVTSIYYHSHTLKEERIESEINAYLHLNDRYQKLLFTLIQNDSEVFKKTDLESMKHNKYLIYELFELLSTVDSLEGYFKELGEDLWPAWKKRMEFLFAKPALQHAWKSHIGYAKSIYKPDFIRQVEEVIAQVNSEIADLDQQ